jgi:hypothetical protein
MNEAFDSLVQWHFKELQAKYPGLALVQNALGEWSVKGMLKFSATYEEAEIIDDEYEIELTIPQDYPSGIPIALELSGRTKGFHTNHDGTLCLGAPLAVRIAFNKTPTLLGFVENCLIHFLYSYSYKNLYGDLPFGDLPHGSSGIFKYYQDFFEVTDGSAVLGLLRILADADYRGHLECPCGSGVRIRNCHGDQLRYAGSFQKVNDFMMDYLNIFKWLHDKGENIPLSCFSKTLSKSKNRQHKTPPNH